MRSEFWRHMAVFAANVSQEMNTAQLLRMCDIKIHFAFAFPGSMNRALEKLHSDMVINTDSVKFLAAVPSDLQHI